MICSRCHKEKPVAEFAIRRSDAPSNVHFIGGERHDFTGKVICTQCWHELGG